MTPAIHRLALKTREHFGRKPPPRHVGLLLAEVQPMARATVAMAFRNRSCVRGKAPDWLERASDIRFAGIEDDGDTALVFEVPRFGDVASELYKQRSLFDTQPDAEDTAFDVLGDVLRDVAAEATDSERYDDPLLRRLARFRRAFEGPFEEVRLTSRREPATLSQTVVACAERLSAKTPAPRRVRLVGTLHTVSQSQAFALKMDSGVLVRGALVEGAIADLGQHFTERVLVFGTAHFRPSGNLLRIDADEFRAAIDSDAFFAKVPRSLGTRLAKPAPAAREKMARGLKAVMGQWPGTETDEELAAALKELG